MDAAISDSVEATVAFFREQPKAFGTFATKFINPELLTYDPQRKTRIRFSLLPQRVSKLVDVRTDALDKRMAAINDFFQAGYEVHVNFSPIIVYEGWLQDYRELFKQLNTVVQPAVKKQMSCECIFLTHNQGQHEINLGINPKAEELLRDPRIQESKRSQFGGINLRYKYSLKARWVNEFRMLHKEVIPWCSIRYIF